MKCLFFLYWESREIRQEFICLMLVSGSKCVRLQLCSGCEPLALTLQSTAGRGASTATTWRRRRRRRRRAKTNMFLSVLGSFFIVSLQLSLPFKMLVCNFVRAQSKRQSIGHERHHMAQEELKKSVETNVSHLLVWTLQFYLFLPLDCTL